MALSELPDIYFIRHGETDWNAEGRYQGRQDIPLNAKGRLQAKANGLLLRELLQRDGGSLEDFNWYVSPLSRAVDTMTIVRSSFDETITKPEIDDRLIEVSFGEFEGSLHQDLKKSFAKRGMRGNDFWKYCPKGGESYEGMAVRVRPFFDMLTKPSIVVSHGGVARVVRHIIEGLPQADAVNWPTPQNVIMHFSKGRMVVHEAETL